jgi:hypothetical protein
VPIRTFIKRNSKLSFEERPFCKISQKSLTLIRPVVPAFKRFSLCLIQEYIPQCGIGLAKEEDSF